MQKNVLTDPRLYDPTAGVPKKKKKKVGMAEGLKTVFTSGYIGCIALMVVFYGMSVNFVEIYYKGAFGSFFPKHMKLRMTGYLSLATGTIAIILLLSVGSKFINKFGWTKTALITPTIVGTFGLPFLVIEYLQFKGTFNSPLLSIIIGLFAVASSKSFKYSFFDPTKEMSYIPLDDSTRNRGKAAVDVVGARLGKSGSGFIQIGFMWAMQTNSRFDYLNILIVLLMVGVASWYTGAIILGRKFERLMAQREAEIAAARGEKQQEKA
jgi:AAA family ATP:ADP antiporter